VPGHGHQVAQPGGAQPIEFQGIETHPAAIEHLMQRHAVVHKADKGSVPGRLAEHEIGRQHVTAARHVLHDHGGTAGDVSRHVFCDRASGQVEDAADARAYHRGDGLALVEALDRFGAGGWQRK
jgi:hypothetical protein